MWHPAPCVPCVAPLWYQIYPCSRVSLATYVRLATYGPPFGLPVARSCALLGRSVVLDRVWKRPCVSFSFFFGEFSSRCPSPALLFLPSLPTPQTVVADCCQDKTICAAVVGLSVNLNVLDVAEKRVKSRFSFRQVGQEVYQEVSQRPTKRQKQ